MTKTTRNAAIIAAAILIAIAVFDPNFFLLRILGTIQAISFTVLAWVAIAYLAKRM